jgi:hypothetical protein
VYSAFMHRPMTIMHTKSTCKQQASVSISGVSLYFITVYSGYCLFYAGLGAVHGPLILYMLRRSVQCMFINVFKGIINLNNLSTFSCNPTCLDPSRTVNSYYQGRKRTYSVTLWSVRESLMLWKSSVTYLPACVLVGARARGYVHARARVALLFQHETYMRHIVTSFVDPLAPPHFSTLSHKRNNFHKSVIER